MLFKQSKYFFVALPRCFCNLSIKSTEYWKEDHEKANKNKSLTYKDTITGFNVFTEYAHLQRGVCCGSKCRHCPFSYINVNKKS